MTRDQQRASRKPDACVGQACLTSSQPAREAASALHLVRRAEHEVSEARKLFEKSRTDLLSEAEWRELSQLFSRNEILDTLPPPPSDLRRGKNIATRVFKMSHRFKSRPFQWAIIGSEVRLPGRQEHSAKVESRVVPGEALGRRFGDGYPLNGVDHRLPVPYARALGLASTTLVSEKQRLLYAGLRVSPLQLNQAPAYLQYHLDDEQRFNLALDLLIRDGSSPISSETCEHIAREIRFSCNVATQYARRLHDEAQRSLERDVPAAALVADPEKLHKALGGETVDLHLGVIRTGRLCKASWAKRLLVPEMRDAAQTAANESLPGLHRRSGVPVQIGLIDGNERERQVSARVWIRDFFVDLHKRKVRGTTTLPEGADEVSCASGQATPQRVSAASKGASLGRLIGDAGSSDIGGDVETAVQTMHARARRLRCQSDELRRESRNVNPVVAGRESLSMALCGERESARLRDQAEALDNNARTLLAASAQLKQLLGSWGRSQYSLPVPVEDQVSARLALICHLMGETPVICRAHGDFAQQLDAEVKFLAAVADNCNGSLPPLNGDAEAWGRAREEFRVSLAGQSRDFFDGDSWQQPVRLEDGRPIQLPSAEFGLPVGNLEIR